MSKLTAEKARERITHLKSWQEQRGLTLREEEYLEGLERMILAEARVQELEALIESMELQAVADAAADDYYGSLAP